MKNLREKKAFVGICCRVFMLVALGLCSVTTLWASSNSASPQRVTINLKDAAIKQVFAEIRKQTTYNFVYSDDQMDKLKKVTVNVKEETVEQVLNQVLSGTPYTYTIEGNAIAIVARGEAAEKVKETKISGKVVDKDGLPLPGVSVLIKGTTLGVATDIDGKYSLSFVSQPNVILVFSFVGMQTKEIPYAGQSEVNVTLEDEQVNLNDVVVIGYGSKSKHDVTSSVSSLSADELQKYSSSATSFDGMLGGALKGVRVTQNNGAPGAAATINVRGITSPVSGSTNEPLYVIDDVPFFSERGGVNPLLVISPNDIESIDVLKDAAATAIYGSRGANGVIIVKTKTGKNNEKMSISAGYSVTIGNPVKRYKPLNTTEFKEVQDLLIKNTMSAMDKGQIDGATGAYFLVPMMELVGNFSMSGMDDDWNPLYTYDGLKEDAFEDVSTNWVKEIENRNALNQQFDLGIRGGGKAINYSFSFNSVNQDGLYINDGLKRYGARLAVDANITERLKSGATMGYTFSKLRDATGLSEMDTKPWLVRPDRAVRDENGNFVRLPGSNYGEEFLGANPVAKRSVKNRTNVYQFIGSTYAQYRIFDNLKIRGDFNIASFRNDGNCFTPLEAMDDMIYYESYSSLYQTSSNTTNTSINFRADYNLDIKDHHLTFMVGYGWDRTFSEGNSQLYSDFADDEILNNASSAASVSSYNSSKVTNGLNSVYARVGYIYADRYLAEVNFRSDASSKFGPGNKRGYFPSLSLGWRMSNERFMEQFTKLDDLKLRFSVGQTGSTNIDNFIYKQLYWRASNNLWGGKPTIVPKDVFPNRDVRWEMTTEYNFGVDFSFFNRRLYGSFDMYYRFTDGALTPSPVALETGSITYYSNLIDLSNKGIELEVGGDVFRRDDWVWTSKFNIALNRNKIEDLNGATLSSTQMDYFIKGKPAGSLKGYVVDGIFQSDEEVALYNKRAEEKNGEGSYYQNTSTGAGDYIYRDLNGDGKITSDDRRVIANPEPDFFGGWFNSINYKNWNLSFVFQFSKGGEALLYDLQYSAAGLVGNSIPRELFRDTWTEDNKDAHYARLIALDQSSTTRNSDRYVFETSYLRLKNISLSYELPHRWLKKISLQSAQLFASASNLWTWTNWPGLDPELVGDRTLAGTNPLQEGVYSNDAYPLSKTFTFGIRVNF